MSASVLPQPRNFVVDVGDVDAVIVDVGDVDAVIVDVDVVVAVCQDAGPSVILLPQPRDLAELLCID